MTTFASASLPVLGCVLALLPAFVASEAFFVSDADPFLGRIVDTRPMVHAKVEAALRTLFNHTSSTEDRLTKLDTQLNPTFVALPKNKHNRLGVPATRYLLHRHFLRRHGWLVNGLAPDGHALNASSLAMILKRVPWQVQELIDQRLHGRGFTLREAAVLGIILENQIQGESAKKLQVAWRAHRLPISGPVRMAKAEEALDTYMMGLILGIDVASMTTTQLLQKKNGLFKAYPGFPKTQAFVRQMCRRTVHGGQQHLTLADAKRVAVGINDQYGLWQNAECHELKDELLAMEGVRPGRVDLHKYYDHAGSTGKTQFVESVAYLRNLGALDESDSNSVSVMVPNLIISPSNYVLTSDLYSTSCLNECEGLLGYLERNVAAPEATESQIVSLVEGLPSSSQAARVALPVSLHQRLAEIAQIHDGKVPLHGRLFAQWMHHAYPRECPYPQVAGTTKPMIPQAFTAHTGIDAIASTEEMMRVIDAHRRLNSQSLPSGSQDLPWDAREELLEVSEARATGMQWYAAAVACVVALVALGGAFLRRAFSKQSQVPLLAVETCYGSNHVMSSVGDALPATS